MRVGAFLQRLALAVAFVTAVVAAPAGAASGELDPSFGFGGAAFTDFAGKLDAAFAVALQPDGKVLAAGYATGPSGERLALVRHNPDGSLDRSFGASGRVTTDLPGDEATVNELLLLANGKFVAVGTAWDFRAGARIAVVRYLPGGSPDPSFGGGDGVQLIGNDVLGDVECGVSGAGAAFDAQARIVIAGTSGCGGEDGWLEAAVARLTPEGALDASFAGDGARRYGLGCEANAVAVQPDGRIVFVGTAEWGDYCADGPMYAARVGPDGLPDRSFGRRGSVRVKFPRTAFSAASDVLIDPVGRIILAGRAQRHPYRKATAGTFALARLQAEGIVDRSFGVNGRQLSDLGPKTDDWAASVALTPTGAIVAAGGSTPYRQPRNSAFGLGRYGPDGQPDPSFSGDGLQRFAFGPASGAYAVAVAPDGRIVIAGRVHPLARLGNFTVLRVTG